MADSLGHQRVAAGRTRAEKVAEAQRLRAEGLMLREIAERMGAPVTTVHTWLADPDLSKQRARRESYRGICDTCGGPTNGSGGYNAPTRCFDCLRWTREAIIEAIKDFAAEHGRQPTLTDWHLAGPTNPSSHTCTRHGWNDMLREAGFEPIRIGPTEGAERAQYMAEQIRAGRSTREVANELGISVQSVWVGLNYRGVFIEQLRGLMPQPERDETIVRLYREGVPLAKIAEITGVASAHVVQTRTTTLRKRGIDLPYRKPGAGQRKAAA